MSTRSALCDAPAPPAARRRILYVQPGTTMFAGIERVVDMICSALSEKYSNDFEVDVLHTSVHENAPHTPRHYKSIHRVAQTRISLLRVIRSTIKSGNYDLVVSPQVEPTAICWVACLGLGQGFAMHLHGNPSLEQSHIKAKILFFVMKWFALRHLRSVFGTSPRQLETFARMFPSGPPRYWLPNPVRPFAASEKPTSAGHFVTFVNVGRYTYQKGHDILLEAFGRLVAERPQARLKLVGHGADADSLRQQIIRLRLTDTVRMEYLPDNPEPALQSSDIYVSTSRWEGWSLAICEALRFGLPVVSTDCDFGPSDILTDERLGRLVPPDDLDALVATMRHYCDHLSEEKQHSSFRRDHIDRYSLDNVVHVHARALKEACDRSSVSRD